MKYSKFIQSVRDLGYRVDDIGNFLYVTTTTGNQLIAINKAKAYSVDSTYDRFDSMLPDDDKKALLALTYELAMTPLEEREDEKRYRLKIPFIGDSLAYLNMHREDENKLILSTCGESISYQAVFTEAEIVTLEEKYNLDSFVREEVKDEN